MNVNLINECLQCVPVICGFLVSCMLVLTICKCFEILERVFVSFQKRKNLEKKENVKFILKEINNERQENTFKEN